VAFFHEFRLASPVANSFHPFVMCTDYPVHPFHPCILFQSHQQIPMFF
jgi:hypothetical protein